MRGCLTGIDTKLGTISPGLVTFTAAEQIDAGMFAYISGNNSVSKAIATSLAASKVVGLAEAQILAAASGTIDTGDGAPLATMQLATGLTVNAGDDIYLSDATAGYGTNVAPTTSGRVVRKIAEVKDASGYVSGTGLGATGIQRIGPATVLA